MRFEFHTTLWGDWHLNTFEDVAVPTLVAPGNLPALADHECEYRIYTTPLGRKRIEQMSILGVLRSLMPVEFVMVRNDENYAALNHMEIWHQAAEHARETGSILVVIPPDTIWPNGVYAKLAEIMARPEINSLAIPYMLAVSETAVPEIRAGYAEAPESRVKIEPSELMELVLRHLHPHLITLQPDCPHGRPPLETIWPIPGEGLLLRCYVRELFAINMERVVLTEHFYGANIDTPDEYYLPRDSEEMFMVGLHSLLKYSYLFHPDRPTNPVDLAACSLVGVNRAPGAWNYGKRPIYYRTKKFTPSKWRRAERESLIFFCRAMMAREFLLIREAAHQSNASLVARVISLAIQATSIANVWRDYRPVTAFIPGDACVQGKLKDQLMELCAPGNEERLIRAIRNHAIPETIEPPEGAAGQKWSRRATALGKAEIRIDCRDGKLLVNDRASIIDSKRVGDAGHQVYFTDEPIFDTGFEAE